MSHRQNITKHYKKNIDTASSAHGFAHLVLIIGILIFSLLGASAYFVKPNDYQSCINFPGSSETEMFPPTCTTIYSDSFKYKPPAEQQKLLTRQKEKIETTDNWQVYRNEEYGFQTKYHPDAPPTEHQGSETTGQFSYILKVDFGTIPLKAKKGYTLTVGNKSIEGYKIDLVGHNTDKINSEEKIEINGNEWAKLNYDVFITTKTVPITTAITHKNDKSYAITASTNNIDQILSTFEFIDDSRSIVQQTTPQNLSVSCRTDSDCQKYISHNDCQLYCANTNEGNDNVINNLPVSCDSTLWDPPLGLNCGCVENKCQLYEQ